MLLSRSKKYLYIPFCSEFSSEDFYTFESVGDLLKKCEKNKERSFKCRTIGILESSNGIFNVKDIYYGKRNKEDAILVSMTYLKQPLTSTVKPQTIQLFGYLQWEGRAIIYANIVQVLISPLALQLREAMDTIVNRHLAKQISKHEDKTL